ncbi:hypothetical protein ERJ75_001158000 [Trypanosoma vivax]|nr:hypothetical protein ERJ75_001158000 [Trypanosoma vivax]
MRRCEEEDRGDTEQRAGRGLGARAQTLGKVGEANAGAGGELDSQRDTGQFCARGGQGTDTRVCSAKNELDTCTKKATEAQEKVTEAVAPAHATKETKWYQRVSGNRARQRTRRTCASVPRWSTCARARTTVTHASAKARKQAHSAEETQTAVKATQASRRNLAESKDRAVQGKNNGQKYQKHNRTLLGTGTRQEQWGRQGPTIGRVRQLWRDQQ